MSGRCPLLCSGRTDLVLHLLELERVDRRATSLSGNSLCVTRHERKHLPFLLPACRNLDLADDVEVVDAQFDIPARLCECESS